LRFNLLKNTNAENWKLARIRLCLTFGALLLLPFSLFLSPTLASDRSEQVHALPPLTVPTIPADGNPFRREVFSLKELREDDGPLLERLVATRMDFPLMFDPYSRFAADLFPNPGRARFGKNFSINILLHPISWRRDSLEALRALKGELAAQGLDRARTVREIRLEFLVFLKNRHILREYIETFPDLSAEAQTEIVDTLDGVFDVCRRVLEYKELTLNGIRTLDRIGVDREDTEAEELQFERFVEESKGMRAKDISSILEIRNPAQFRELCLERTSELLADAENEDVEELLAGIEPSDAIVLAAYFARDRVQTYRKPVDQMRDLYENQPPEDDEELQVGDCRHLAGLTAHYLNLVVKPNNPKLRHWHFGIQRESISDYHHAYVIAAHSYEEQGRENIDLFFIDPVILSSRSLGKLRKKDISRLIDAASKDDHFFYIKRYGEDFVARRSKSSNSINDAAHSEEQAGRISFDTLLDRR